MAIMFQFNQTKAVESILYLAQGIANPDVYGICKLLYLADKTSLEKYGRFIFGGEYYAMQSGPVPSEVYDMLKPNAQRSEYGFTVENNRITRTRGPNLDYLSESDVECLDQIIRIYGDVPYWKRRADSHDTAWQQAWNMKGNSGSVPMPIESIVELLDDSEELIDYLVNRDAE